MQFPVSDVLDDCGQRSYRQMVGLFQYLTATQPTISFLVNKMSQFMVKPTLSHWSALQRILCYLCSNPLSGLWIKKMISDRLEAFSDTDCANDVQDKQRHGRHFVFWGGNLILCSSRKQPTMARSSTEVEYKSLADTASNINRIEEILQELGMKVEHVKSRTFSSTKQSILQILEFYIH